MRERPDSGETRVAGTHAIAPYTLQMVEKGQNIVGAKLTESELINRPVVPFGEEPQQNPEGGRARAYYSFREAGLI
jgi:hypothetical protein